MRTAAEKSRVTFRELEKNIFRYVCGPAAEMTKALPKEYGGELHTGRDRKTYRDRRKQTATIKTICGDVTYDRYVYQTQAVCLPAGRGSENG